MLRSFGAPDQTVDYISLPAPSRAQQAGGQGEYQAARAQTAPEYVAVAAFTDTEQGPAAELLLDLPAGRQAGTLSRPSARRTNTLLPPAASDIAAPHPNFHVQEDVDKPARICKMLWWFP